jgi:hypothetical protein
MLTAQNTPRYHGDMISAKKTPRIIAISGFKNL